MRAKPIILGILVFYVSVVAFTFGTTILHEAAHAAAWDATEAPEFRFASDRDAAKESIGQEKRMALDGVTYRVIYVDATTIALYPANIAITGATLSLAPASLMDDAILGSTFYAFDQGDYERLAAGEEVTEWHHSAMPMIVNGLLMVPMWGWMLWKKNAISMAAVWANAAEWRFNAHHAQEIGMDPGLYMGLAVLFMLIAAGAITYLAASKVKIARVYSGRAWDLA